MTRAATGTETKVEGSCLKGGAGTRGARVGAAGELQKNKQIEYSNRNTMRRSRRRRSNNKKKTRRRSKRRRNMKRSSSSSSGSISLTRVKEEEEYEE